MQNENLIHHSTENFHVTVGKDPDGRWEAVLENSKIQVRYGYLRTEDAEEGMITSLILKDYPEENEAGHLLEASAHRGVIENVEVIYDTAHLKTVRISWEPGLNKNHRDHAISDVSIFPDSKMIKIEYIQYCYPHICDIGTPGGLKGQLTDEGVGGDYRIYGSEEWKAQRTAMSNEALRNHPNPHHRLTNDLFPLYPNPIIDSGWGKSPMEYKGWYIMGVYHKEKLRGFARLVPARIVPCIKLLWNKGFEFFPCWNMQKEPFTSYLYLVENGSDEIMEIGKKMIDSITSV